MSRHFSVVVLNTKSGHFFCNAFTYSSVLLQSMADGNILDHLFLQSKASNRLSIMLPTTSCVRFSAKAIWRNVLGLSVHLIATSVLVSSADQILVGLLHRAKPANEVSQDHTEPGGAN